MRLQCQLARNVAYTAGVTVIFCALLSSCRWQKVDVHTSIVFSRVPQSAEDGRDKNDIIEGRVIGGHPGQRIVLYAYSGRWWIQPLVEQPFTTVQPNSKWTNATHLGTEYAALLVEPGYIPPPVTDALPSRGGAVAAVAIVKGQALPPSPSLHFSGYEWRVRDSPSSRGGWNLYNPRNAWTDDSGALHLRISKVSGEWTCAELTLTRSLGYGTYSFLVRDTSALDPAVVLGLFTWDYAGADQNHREMDIEISRWGDPTTQNAQYVIQPFYLPRNVVRFFAPPGPLTHSLRWETGRVAFKTTLTSASGHPGHTIAEHVFTSGVPTPGMESVRMNLYIFKQFSSFLRNGSEVVVDKFEYLP